MSAPHLLLESPAVEYRADADLSPEEDRALRQFLFSCFPHKPAFLARRFVKKSPAHRWMLFDEAARVIAHAAVHEKTIGTARSDLCIGGVAEVCVAAAHRGRGLVKAILSSVHESLTARGIPFAMLFGQPGVYASSGYVLIRNPLRTANALPLAWNPFCGKPMVRALSAEPWPAGMIDLRGPTF